jgi:hypothetical protein
MKEISTRQKKFADLVGNGKPAKDAAIEAGFSAGSAAAQAQRLLKNPMVQAAVAERERRNVKFATYNIDSCMAELDDCIAFARMPGSKSPSAISMCLKLKAELNGLLSKAAAENTAGFTISIVGLASPDPGAQASVANTPPWPFLEAVPK